MVLPLTTRLRSWRHNAWLVGNESRRSASRSPAQRAGGQHSTNKNLFPIRALVATLATTHSINQLLLWTSLQKHCVQWQHHHRCCFSLNQQKRCCSQFWDSTKSKFWTEFDCSVSCYWQATTGKLAVEWTLTATHVGSKNHSNLACAWCIVSEIRWYNRFFVHFSCFLCGFSTP